MVLDVACKLHADLHPEREPTCHTSPSGRCLECHNERDIVRKGILLCEGGRNRPGAGLNLILAGAVSNTCREARACKLVVILTWIVTGAKDIVTICGRHDGGAGDRIHTSAWEHLGITGMSIDGR